jgi:hypothetical protein
VDAIEKLEARRESETAKSDNRSGAPSRWWHANGQDRRPHVAGAMDIAGARMLWAAPIAGCHTTSTLRRALPPDGEPDITDGRPAAYQPKRGGGLRAGNLQEAAPCKPSTEHVGRDRPVHDGVTVMTSARDIGTTPNVNVWECPFGSILRFEVGRRSGRAGFPIARLTFRPLEWSAMHS